MLSQKFGLTGLLILAITQTTPILLIDANILLIFIGRSGINLEINGTGTVEITWSNCSNLELTSMPVILLFSITTFETGELKLISPPNSKIDAERAFKRVFDPPSI